MRILHITTDANLGGGNVNVARLIKSSSTGFQHGVIVPADSGPVVEALFSCSVLKGRNLSRGSVFQIARSIVDHSSSYNLLHAHGTRAALAAWLASRFTKQPWVYTVRGYHMFSGSRLKALAAPHIESVLCRTAARVIHVSRSDREISKLHKLPFSEAPLLIENGIEDCTSALPFDQREIDVVFIGRMVPQKDPHAFAATLLGVATPLRVVIIGDGPFKAEIEERLAGSIHDVTYISQAAPADVRANLTRAKMLVLTSRWEGLPTVAVEALVAGCWVAGFAIAPLQELLGEHAEGLLTPTRQPERLAKTIEGLLQSRRPPPSGLTRSVTERFSISRMAERYQAAYAAATTSAATRPKVLLISLRSDRSGGPIYIHRLMEGVGQDAELHVAAPDEGALFEAYRNKVGEDHVIPVPTRKFSVSAFFKVLKFVRRRNIKIIHSHGKGAGAYARLLGLLTGARIVHTYHGIHLGDYGKTRTLLYRVYERLAAAFTSAIICVSESERTCALKLGLAPSSKVQVIRTGVPDDAIAPPSSPDSQVKTLLHVTRFDRQKNFEDLIVVAKKLKERFSDSRTARICVIGSGGRQEEYKKLTEIEGVADLFDFKGTVDNPAAMLSGCVGLISTSLWEGLPLAPLEAGLAGRRLFLSDIPAHRELDTASDAVFFFSANDPGSVVRLCDALERDIAASDLAKSAQELAARFDYKRMVDGHLELYRREASPSSP